MERWGEIDGDGWRWRDGEMVRWRRSINHTEYIHS
jgi:hypothetical protein